MIYDEREDDRSPQTEINLSNSTLLLIFLAAAVVCGLCLGLGYSLGKRFSKAPVVAAMPPATAQPPAAEAAPAPAPSPAAAKPSAGSSSTLHAVPRVADAGEKTVVTVEPSKPVPRAASPNRPVVAPAAVPAARAATAKPETPPVATSAQPGARTYIVQVAAVSHPDDATILVSALHRKGYQVNAVTSDKDSLIHVQIGPFATQKDAAAMRDRLSTDGYLAIVK